MCDKNDAPLITSGNHHTDVREHERGRFSTEHNTQQGPPERCGLSLVFMTPTAQGEPQQMHLMTAENHCPRRLCWHD